MGLTIEDQSSKPEAQFAANCECGRFSRLLLQLPNITSCRQKLSTPQASFPDASNTIAMRTLHFLYPNKLMEFMAGQSKVMKGNVKLTKCRSRL